MPSRPAGVQHAVVRSSARTPQTITRSTDVARLDRGESAVNVSARPDPDTVAAEARAFYAPRSYLFVSAREPLAAAAALWSWADGPPDLCITSPSPDAQDTAAFAAAGHFVTIFREPLLARRSPGESWNDFRDRFAEGLRIVSAYDTRAALVVCDEVPDRWSMPFVLDDRSILERAELLEGEVPLP